MLYGPHFCPNVPQDWFDQPYNIAYILLYANSHLVARVYVDIVFPTLLLRQMFLGTLHTHIAYP